ncbi:MAG: outer membrane beta-barrel protein [Gammaproteobacteria bacterium]|nr:outer membrane beta-barrel protein [Gammaproteobacteria bacterium]
MNPTFISTYLPKFLITFLALGISTSVVSQESMNWYTFGGLSFYGDNVKSRVGDGLGYRVGVGFQFNRTVGLELGFDSAAPVEPASLVAVYEEAENVTLLNYSVDTLSNSYTSIMGTLSFPLDERFTLIGKIGYARYRVETTSDIQLAVDELFNYFNVDLSYKDHGNDRILSVGMHVSPKRQYSFELSIQKIFGDAGAQSVNGVWRYRF